MEVSGTGTDNQATTVEQNKQQGNMMGNLDQDAFLQILVTQLQNQDPLNPVNSEDFVSQMAELTSVEQLTSLNQNISELHAKQDKQTVLNLLDKEVAVKNDNGELVTGMVNGASFDEGAKLKIDSQYYNVDSIVEAYSGKNKDD